MAGAAQPGVLHVVLERAFDLKDMDLLHKMESSYAKVMDYSAVFRKLERVEGVLQPEEAIAIKFRKPLQ